MKIRKLAGPDVVRAADGAVRPGSTNIIPFRPADDEEMKPGAAILKFRPPVRPARVTHDVIAEQARTIWPERGSPPDQEEENRHAAGDLPSTR
jgi:hypothetical protein